MELLARLRRHARPLARFGCVSIGTVYVIVGVLAVIALTGELIEVADEERMVQVVMDLPGGAVLIWAIVAGMSGYVLWRFVEVITDPYSYGSGVKGISIRALIAASAIAYGAVAFSAGRMALSYDGETSRGGPDGAEQQQQQLVSRIFQWPAGTWIVALAGVALVGVGVGQFGLLVRRGYTIEVDLDGRSRAMRRAIHGAAWYGYSARGVILTVLGYFLVRAAMTRDPREAGDTDTAFDFIGGGVIGDTAFFVVAVGTIAYGVFMYFNASFYNFRRDGPAEIRRTVP